jgi:hypothetical protein
LFEVPDNLQSGLWGGIIHLPPPPSFDIDTMEPVKPPWQAIKEWIPDDDPNLNWFDQERDPTGAEPECCDQSPAWQAKEKDLANQLSNVNFKEAISEFARSKNWTNPGNLCYRYAFAVSPVVFCS